MLVHLSYSGDVLAWPKRTIIMGFSTVLWYGTPLPVRTMVEKDDFLEFESTKLRYAGSRLEGQ
jgi:hypothetical protein